MSGSFFNQTAYTPFCVLCRLIKRCETSLEVFSHPGEFDRDSKKICLTMTAMGIAVWMMAYLYVTLLNWAAKSNATNIRCLFLQSILRQEMAWYDKKKSASFAASLTE